MTDPPFMRWATRSDRNLRVYFVVLGSGTVLFIAACALVVAEVVFGWPWAWR